MQKRCFLIATLLCVTFVVIQASVHLRVPSYPAKTNFPSPISRTAAQCALPDRTEQLARQWLSQRGCSGYDSENVQVFRYLGSCEESSGKCYGSVVFKNSSRGGNIATVTFYCGNSTDGSSTKPDYCCSSVTRKYCPFNTPSPSPSRSRSPSISSSRSSSPSISSSRSPSPSISSSPSLSPSISSSPSLSPSIIPCVNINSTCVNNADCCAPYICDGGFCDISCRFAFCDTNADCCAGAYCYTIPDPMIDPINNRRGLSFGKLCIPIGEGCYIGTTPVKLSNGTSILTEDLKVGDAILSPDGQAEVIYISTQILNDISIFGWNGIEPWATGEHLFPPALSNTSLDLSLYLSPIPELTANTSPWAINQISTLRGGDRIGRLNNNQVSIVTVQNYTRRYKSFSGKVYNYVAWPSNSTARVPTLYMMGHDYIGYSALQLDLIIAANWLVIGQVYLQLEGFEQNGTINSVPSYSSATCWGDSIGVLHASWLNADLPAAHDSLYGEVPQTPPSGYDGPADEWIDNFKNLFVQLGQSSTFKRRSESDESNGFLSSVGASSSSWYVQMQRIYLPNTIWLNWVSYEQGAAVIGRALQMFMERNARYDYSSLCHEQA